MATQPFGTSYDAVGGQSMGLSGMQGLGGIEFMLWMEFVLIVLLSCNTGANAMKKKPRTTKEKEKDRDKVLYFYILLTILTVVGQFKDKGGKDKDKSRTADKGMAEMKERDFQQPMYSMADDNPMMIMGQLGLSINHLRSCYSIIIILTLLFRSAAPRSGEWPTPAASTPTVTASTAPPTTAPAAAPTADAAPAARQQQLAQSAGLRRHGAIVEIRSLKSRK